MRRSDGRRTQIVTELVSRTTQSRITTNSAKEITVTCRPGITLIRQLALINLACVGLQPISAGFFLSGYEYAVPAHAGVAMALQLGSLIQVVTAIVLWRRNRAPAWVAGISIGLFAMVLLQVGLGHSRRYWLHVPLGVGIFGWLARQVTRLDTLRSTNGARSVTARDAEVSSDIGSGV
jgi:hypothetical protein